MHLGNCLISETSIHETGGEDQTAGRPPRSTGAERPLDPPELPLGLLREVPQDLADRFRLPSQESDFRDQLIQLLQKFHHQSLTIYILPYLVFVLKFASRDTRALPLEIDRKIRLIVYK